jgi:FkbM family methyltransferase
MKSPGFYFKKIISKLQPHKKYSYSQTGEDVIIDFIFQHILRLPNFTYFDIGAHHPTYLSNTALFYKNGMTGICVEPDPVLHEKIVKARSKDTCLNIGIGFNEDENLEEELEFYIMSARTLNTFSRQEAERLNSEGQYKIVESKKIPVIHIHKLFKKYFIPDFLSIDVEGIDMEILHSINIEKYRPKVICIETAEFSPVPPGRKEEEAIIYLKEKGYMVYADTFNNTIFIDNNYLQKIYK